MENNYTIVKELTYKGLPVNKGKFNNLDLYEEPLEAIHKRIMYVSEKYTRIYIYRFDVTLPDSINKSDIDVNVSLSEAIQNTVKHLKVKTKSKTNTFRNHKTVSYLWVKEDDTGTKREGEKEKGIHYHGFFVLSGHSVRFSGENDFELYAILNKYWKNACLKNHSAEGGYVSPSEGNDVPVFIDFDGVTRKPKDKSHQKKLEKAFFALSYLAKTNTKVITKGKKLYSGNQLNS
ncbi:YagK/YfjJ domain-containing protein [Zhongshania aliphaticivorans]|uniref:YagK/YfjJ C-terminal domain-containing protein n=1 Tax=Zhongshania aliphaticivorans TaxID=1470434 RepID=A0A127M120_9GAMM|nr:inovirus-type Gp2 protein [Zhongshania aliphaticivorans]AMO66921.1 hypothetical protein AZF00_00775 [Zhongshania aliphaticivorans]